MAAMRWQDPKDDERLDQALERLLAEISDLEAAPLSEEETFRDMDQRLNVDLDEDAHSYRLIAEVPGVAASELRVLAGPRSLTIEGRWGGATPSAKGRSHLLETRRGAFRRVIALPGPAAGETSHAVLENGILVVVLPKSSESPDRLIDIGLGAK